MWGMSWGQMVWGHAGSTAVPAVGFWGMIALGATLGALGLRRLRGPRPRVVGMIALALALLVPISARALPFTFTNGTVADATQVNANFAAAAAAQGLAPAASSNLIDLESSGACPEASSGITLGNAVGSDGIGRAFSIATGQTLVLTGVSVAFTAGSASANHGVSVRFVRFLPTGGSPIEAAVVTLDAAGGGSANINISGGSPFGPGTNLCVLSQDIGTGVNLTPSFAIAHGFLTTQ